MILHPEPYKYVERREKPLDIGASLNGSSAYLRLSGLGCSNCANHVHNALLSLDGVWLVEVFLWERVALVAFDPKRLDPSRFPSIVQRASPSDRCFRAEVLEVRPSRQTLRVMAGRLLWCWPGRVAPEPTGAWN